MLRCYRGKVAAYMKQSGICTTLNYSQGTLPIYISRYIQLYIPFATYKLFTLMRIILIQKNIFHLFAGCIKETMW